MTGRPRAAVLIPMLDEAADLARCLSAVLDQDFPREALEVVVVDGGSTDGSVELARELLGHAGLARWAVLQNPRRTIPSNLDMGLANVTAAYVCRVDARSLVQRDYVRRCVERLESDSSVAVVGGAQVAVARSEAARDQGIARALNNRLTMGGASYRSGGPAGPTDTVYLGAFRTRELRAVGGWDERFPTNEDFELNRRLGTRGSVWYDPEIRSGYLPRSSVRALWRQYLRFGRWKVRYWRLTGDRPQRRQWVALLAPAAVVVLVGRAVAQKPRRGPALAGLAVLGALGLDAAGTAGPARPLVRVWAASATAAVTLGWWVGAVVELVIRPR